MRLRSLLLFAAVLIFAVSSCDEGNDDPVGEVTFPEIINLTADKTTIQFGGHDPITITCEATGGELDYTWYVDLGDIIPMNEDRSVIQYTASDCCIGDKLLTCTVENSMGSITDTISVYINLPE